jgi:cyclopropane-fatty-acyl-phospholipid synthase
VTSLAEAEEQALRVTCDRAGLVDGQDILELGCGWGALSLWMAEHYPRSRITAMSNSTAQRRHIATMAAERGLLNLRVLTADINEFAPPVGVSRDDRFDRIVSLEMFEHLRNYELLLERIASWLRDDGRLFVHIFCHRDWAYSFETTGTANWMGRYFFTGGIMPSFDLLKQFERQMTVCDDWHWNGSHYQHTAEAWLSNLDSHQPRVLDSLAMTYGPAHAKRWLHRWRMFFLAVAELFGYAEGREWYVGHYLLRPTQRTS